MTRAQMIKALTPLVVACLAVLVVYWPTAVSMAEVWDRSNTYAHGWVIPPISLWLMWRERAALRAVPLQPSWWGLLPLGASMGLWLAGDLVAVNAATQLALVGMLVSMVPPSSTHSPCDASNSTASPNNNWDVISASCRGSLRSGATGTTQRALFI